MDSHCRSVIGSIVVQSGRESVAVSWQDVSAALKVHVGCGGEEVLLLSAGCAIMEVEGVWTVPAFGGEPLPFHISPRQRPHRSSSYEDCSRELLYSHC